ncbi:BTB/POZ protein [Rhizophagus irregularis DAOM 181602=DAOM 197198]|nr:BTB/POZ protein [Rhizophagus irregularis DAOM 181602=DAOM 197198]
MASDELNLHKLSDFIQTYLIDNQAEYLKNDPVGALQIVFRYEGCEDLRKFCLDAICKNPKTLFESPKFTSLEKDLIILFLKNNELEMEEIEIWEFVLKWALERMSTQHNVDDLSQWTSKNGLLIGGYNPLSWHPYNSHVNNDGSWQSTSDSFLFSFAKKEEINSASLTRVKDDDNYQIYAVSYNLNYGPAFGIGWDLIIEHNNIIKTYGNGIYSGVYNIIKYEIDYILEDYEVYQFSATILFLSLIFENKWRKTCYGHNLIIQAGEGQKKDLIILFLKSNELEMEEIDIWESILKWALERMSTQHDNVDNLSRWTSKIHLSIIASWVGKMEKSFYNNKSLYRGFEAAIFHELCDNKGSTIIISNQKKMGDYNPLSWHPYNSHVQIMELGN